VPRGALLPATTAPSITTAPPATTVVRAPSRAWPRVTRPAPPATTVVRAPSRVLRPGAMSPGAMSPGAMSPGRSANSPTPRSRSAA
jgi:hypothetical protein